MEIKKNLKAIDVKISKLASELGISRPTLDIYIECYESGKQIPNGGYQKIFEYLFANEHMDSIEFVQKYDYVKKVMLKDAQAGAEKMIKEKREDILLERVRALLNTDAVDRPLLEFFNLFITNKNIDLVKSIYMYFNFTNGYIDMTTQEVTDKDKALFSNLSKIFGDYQNNKIELLESYYNQVFSKNQSVFQKNRLLINDNDIIEYIKNNLQDSSSIDIRVLKQMIESREEK